MIVSDVQTLQPLTSCRPLSTMSPLLLQSSKRPVYLKYSTERSNLALNLQLRYVFFLPPPVFCLLTFNCQVLQAIPNAIGALCLNEAGQAQLTKRPSIIPAIFSIFTSERHLKTLIDKENAVIIGTAVDELIRHHPSLKLQVFDALKSTLSRIEDLGSSYSPPADIKHWYQLVPVSTSLDDDVTMQEDAGMESPVSIDAPQVVVEDIDDDNEDDDPSAKSHDNIVVSYIDIVGRVSSQKVDFACSFPHLFSVFGGILPTPTSL